MRITLCRTQFDRENDNVLLFDSKEDLKSYFDNLTDKVQIQKEINFNAKDIIRTVQYIDIPNEIALFKLLNYNYCYIDGNENDNRLYFFIERSYQDSGNQIRLELKADVWNTYIYNCMSSTKALQAMIQKTHLDRFIASGNDYIYNFASDSPLFERETIKDVAKRAVSKYKLKSQIDTTGKHTNFNDFINENISCWVYYYVQPGKYKFYDIFTQNYGEKSLDTIVYYKNGNKFTNGSFVVLCAPIYKNRNSHKIRIVDAISYTNEIIWDEDAILDIINESGGNAKLITKKYSIMPPMVIKNYVENTDYAINDPLYTGDLLINKDFNTYGSLAYQNNIFIQSAGNACFVIGHAEIAKENTLRLFLDDDLATWTYTKAQIKAQSLEPKLNNEDYASYKLIFAGNEYEMPISKTSIRPQFIYREIFSPDVTKALLTYDTTANQFSDNVLKDITESDYSGFSISVDLSIWFYTDKLSEYIANNKNYLQIFKNTQDQKTTKAGLAVASKSFSGDVFSALQIGVNGIIDRAFEQTNFDLSIDNMKNAPGTINNINSDPVLMLTVADLGFYIEKLEALPFEQELVKDNLKMFGYTYNRIGDIYSHAKTRKYYNYIQAIVFDIDAPICETIKDEIKQSFSRGIRIWHGDTITNVDFTVNNYERYLDNE